MIAHINENGTQTVFEHLMETAELAGRAGARYGLEQLMYLSGLLHDLGKETEAFDSYIRKAFIDPKSVYRGQVNHSSAGGKFIFDKYKSSKMSQKFTAQLIATAIFSHHGLIDCMDSAGYDSFFKRIYPKQEIFYHEALQNSAPIFSQVDVDGIFHRAEEEISKALLTISGIVGNMQGKKSEGNFLVGCLERLILSMLIDADRTNTADFMYHKEPQKSIEIEKLWIKFQKRLDKKLAQFDDHSDINKLRRRVSQECFEFGDRDSGIYCLPIPTGGGKTYCSLRFALNHAIKKKKKKIIYVAPFLSILEQNADEIRDTLQAGDYILEHHSNVVYQNEDEGQINQMKMMTETWGSPIIATTLVQLLNTLFSGKNQNIRRMHQLGDSVIIIDEIQSLPVRCVYMFNVMMNFLAYFCHATIVLCSATQPLLAEVSKKILYSTPCNMVNEANELAHSFKRVNIIDQTKEEYDSAGLAELALNELENDLLIILNTKGAVRNLFAVLSQMIPKGITLFQLSTYMCAQNRSDIIHQIKERLPGQKVICVSTQLIEAGVDISFQCVIRSLAGLDNIMQAAGRCNRNSNEKGIMGKVYIIRYQEEHLGTLEDIKTAREATRGVLYEFNQSKNIFEGDLLSVKAMNRYYERYFWDREKAKYMEFSVTKKEQPILEETVTLYDLLSGNNIGMNAYRHRITDGKMESVPMRQAFRQAGDLFEVIDRNTIGLIVPYKDGKFLIEKLKQTHSMNEIKLILRQLQRYTVNIFREDHILKGLIEKGSVETLFDGSVLILSEQFYQENEGVSAELGLKIF